MRNSLILLLLVVFITGCSVKMQVNKFPDGSIEYNDTFNGDKLQFRIKNDECYPDARMKLSRGIVKVNLTKNCKVIKMDFYSFNGSFIQTMPVNAHEAFENWINEKLTK